jgi:hypothetical protein
MPLWRIQPVADPEDGRWLDHTIWREVVVRAPTAAVARHAAARMELATDRPPTGNEMPSARSAFEDEKLYRVSPLEPTAARGSIENAGAPKILRAEPLEPLP